MKNVLMRGALWLLLSGAAGAMAAPVEIVRAEFGIFDVSNPRETLFEPTRVIPHKEGVRYGWVIEVRTSKRSLSVREEYLLPSQASTEPTTAGAIVIPFERRSQVSQRQLVPQEGRIFGEWEIGRGEPPGRRHLQVVVEDEVAASFEYDVRDAK